MPESSIWSPGDMTGPPGPPGTAATIQVGTVTTGPPGSSVIIVNSGDPTTAIFDFSIPRGDTGIGVQGVPGPPGASVQGPIGPIGLTGSQGIPGTPGSKILSGTGIPSNAVGADGDYFLDQSQAYLYGPKVTGVWPGVFLDLRGGASGVNYGQRAITNNSTVIAKTAATDPNLNTNSDYTQVTGIFEAVGGGINRGITQQTNSLTIARAGTYEVDLWASLSVSAILGSSNIAFKFAVNGVITLVRRPIINFAGANVLGGIAANGLVSLAVGDIVTLWMASTITTNVRIQDALFSLKELR